jgi:hypothetical protein
VVVGWRTGAAVTGAYALEADVWSASRGWRMHEHQPSLNESSCAARRMRSKDLFCGEMQASAMQAMLGKSRLNCRFSGLETMTQ